MSALLSRISLPVAIVAAAIVVGLAYDGAVLINHLQPAAQHTTKKADKSSKPDKSNHANQPDKNTKQHPCNHGFYVSQAAKAHKGGDYVKQIAQSDLGKDGDCSKPLPPPTSTSNPSSDSEED